MYHSNQMVQNTVLSSCFLSLPLQSCSGHTDILFLNSVHPVFSNLPLGPLYTLCLLFGIFPLFFCVAVFNIELSALISPPERDPSHSLILSLSTTFMFYNNLVNSVSLSPLECKLHEGGDLACFTHYHITAANLPQCLVHNRFYEIHE